MVEEKERERKKNGAEREREADRKFRSAANAQGSIL